jgi:phosphatidylserine/phosphatidylglycerophosphate/cardiolipin synthase-like enzyme
MNKASFGVNNFFSRQLISALCLIMGLAATSQAQVSDISDIVVLRDKDSYAKKLELVKNAKTSIWMSVMVFDCKESSKDLFHEMIKKQEEGLDVRILAEGLYMKTISNPCYKYLTESGLKVTQVFDHLRKGGSLARMMHQKFFVIDGEEIVMGGQNFIKY